MKILYLVISSAKSPWNKLATAQKRTWVKSVPGNHQVYFIYGDGSIRGGAQDFRVLHNSKVQQVKSSKQLIAQPITSSTDSIHFHSLDGWEQLLTNTLSGLAHLLDGAEFDFVVRTNNSTYFNPVELENRLKNLPSSGVYAGPKYQHQGIDYVGGYSIILSSDMAQLLISPESNFNLKLIDDVAIGEFFNEAGVIITPFPAIPWITFKKLMKIGLRFRTFYTENSAFRCKAEYKMLNHKVGQFSTSFRLDKYLFYYLNLLSKF